MKSTQNDKKRIYTNNEYYRRDKFKNGNRCYSFISRLLIQTIASGDKNRKFFIIILDGYGHGIHLCTAMIIWEEHFVTSIYEICIPTILNPKAI